MTKKKQSIIDFSDPSTKRGAVWLAASVMAITTSMAGDKDLAMQIFLAGAAVAGILGMQRSDK